MAYDGTLKFDTSVDSGGFKNGITKISSIAKAGLKTAVTAITAVTGALSAGAAAGVKYNAQMEQYITSFGTMLGSAEKATVLVNDLKEMGAKTPFETSDLAKGSQTLLAFGVAADDLLPTLQMLGDVSQGNKERFDSLTLAFAQVSSAGKLTGQDLLQFVNAGFNPLNEICKVTGESMEEVRDRMSKGGVSADEVAQAFKRATGEGGQFYQAMEAQSQTFNGQLSTLKDNVMSFIGDLTQGVTGTLKDTVLPIVNEWMGELQEAFKSGGIEGVISALGGILADACTRLAQAAPGVIDLAVGFIQSFIQGIADNKDKLLTAAKNIVSALVSGLVTLLPREVQKPVKETIDILKKSFQDGGLRSAINTIRTTLQNLGKVATNLAKALLPPLAKAVDFLADNLDILLPLVTGIVATLKTMSIVKSVTTWMTGLKTALGLATVATQGATTAQLALNGAMSANPIGIVIGLVGGLVTALGTLWATTDQATESSDRYNESFSGLSDSFSEVGEGIANFHSSLSQAGDYLDAFDDTMFATAEAQQALADNMQAVQDGITTICRKAAEERRGYTAEEITQLDQYFDQLNELTKQQLDVQLRKLETIQNVSIEEANTFEGTSSEYLAQAKKQINTARQQRDAVIDLAEQQYTTEIALLEQAYKDKGAISATEYTERKKQAEEDRDHAIQTAKDQNAAVVTQWQEGYLQRAEDFQAWLTKQSDLQAQEAALEEERTTNIAKLNEERNKKLEEVENNALLTTQNKGEMKRFWNEHYDGLIEEENTRHRNELDGIYDKMGEDMTELQKEQAKSWAGLVIETDEAGGKLSTEANEASDTFLGAFDHLPEDTKKEFEKAIEEAIEGISGMAASLFNAGTNLVKGFLDRITGGLEEHSPSKAMKRIFGLAVKGGEVGVKDESPELYKEADKTAAGFLKRFSPKLDVSAMVAKMKATVAAQRYSLSASLGGAAAGGMTLSMNTGGIENAVRQGLSGARVEADGRQIGKVVMANWDRTVRTFGR